MLIVKYIRIKVTKYKSTTKLSETLARREFERQNYVVWRGSYFGDKELFSHYPQVKGHYACLELMMRNRLGELTYEQFCNYCEQERGEPDFIVYDSLEKKLFFVEIKLGAESIKKHQLQTMRFIIKEMGIPCEIWRFVSQAVRVHQERIDLPMELPKRLTAHKHVLSKEAKLTTFFPKKSCPSKKETICTETTQTERSSS